MISNEARFEISEWVEWICSRSEPILPVTPEQAQLLLEMEVMDPFPLELIGLGVYGILANRNGSESLVVDLGVADVIG